MVRKIEIYSDKEMQRENEKMEMQRGRRQKNERFPKKGQGWQKRTGEWKGDASHSQDSLLTTLAPACNVVLNGFLNIVFNMDLHLVIIGFLE